MITICLYIGRYQHFQNEWVKDGHCYCFTSPGAKHIINDKNQWQKVK